jgi:hypothetical protein
MNELTVNRTGQLNHPEEAVQEEEGVDEHTRDIADQDMVVQDAISRTDHKCVRIAQYELI